MTVQKMNPEDKAKWLEALRSGKYPQGRDYLQTDDNCYCCLGVLAESKGVPSTKHKNKAYSYAFGTEDCEDSRFGVPNGYCGLTDYTTSVLMGMNDTQRKSFSEIADYIEENL